MKDRTEEGTATDSFEAFVYCFGLRFYPGVADMGSLWKAAQTVDLDAEIQARKRRYEEQARSQSVGLGSLASLASRYGLGSLATSVGSAAMATIRSRILQEVADVIKNEARRVGDVVFTPHDLVQIFKASPSGKGTTMLDEVVFGDTPMALAAREVRQRFERMQGIPYDNRLLLIVSDGEPTDGNPADDISALKESGVVVVSCFVTDEDITEPRTLINSPDIKWEKGVRLMWDLASELDTTSHFAGYLIERDWRIPHGSKLFLQVNHSDILKEFVSAVPAQSQVGAFIPKGQ